jgi:hypothetical protein
MRSLSKFALGRIHGSRQCRVRSRKCSWSLVVPRKPYLAVGIPRTYRQARDNHP